MNSIEKCNVLPQLYTAEERQCSVGMNVYTPWVYNVDYSQYPGSVPPVDPTVF